LPASQLKEEKRGTPSGRMFDRAMLAWLAALVVCAIVLPLCVIYVDRAVADFFNDHFRWSGAWPWLNRALRPFPLVVVAAMFLLFAAAWLRLMGRELSAQWETPMLCSWASMFGLGAERIFKGIFGRPGPDPVYLRMHRYGFDGAGQHHLDAPSAPALAGRRPHRAAIVRRGCRQLALDVGRDLRRVSWRHHRLDDCPAAGRPNINPLTC